MYASSITEDKQNTEGNECHNMGKIKKVDITKHTYTKNGTVTKSK
jgi:hypothetical protein